MEARNLVRLNLDNLSIVLNNLHHLDSPVPSADLAEWGYEVDLEHCGSATKFFELILHRQSKTWFTPQMLDDFIREFHRSFLEVFRTDPRNLQEWEWPTVEQWHKRRRGN
jgi:hypothetical protein